MLEGKKTYITAFLIAVVAMLYHADLIPVTGYQTLLGVLGAGGLASLRSGVKKSENKKGK